MTTLTTYISDRLITVTEAASDYSEPLGAEQQTKAERKMLAWTDQIL